MSSQISYKEYRDLQYWLRWYPAWLPKENIKAPTLKAYVGYLRAANAGTATEKDNPMIRDHSEYETWAEATCKGKFMVHNGMISFELLDDLMLYRLTWHNACNV